MLLVYAKEWLKLLFSRKPNKKLIQTKTRKAIKYKSSLKIHFVLKAFCFKISENKNKNKIRLMITGNLNHADKAKKLVKGAKNINK